ncbi:MAG: lysine 2,3-aminomutase, partial [Nitrospinae bacterium]|nr:lysine 2,3-aminomutase [Nitrospinota bacterium]
MKKDWNSWRWQIKNSIKTHADLIRYFGKDKINRDIEEIFQNSFVALTPYYSSLIQDFSYKDPIFKMMVPHVEELRRVEHLSIDPFSEELYSPVPRLVRRYKDRALIIVTGICSSYCRYCTRKR